MDHVITYHNYVQEFACEFLCDFLMFDISRQNDPRKFTKKIMEKFIEKFTDKFTDGLTGQKQTDHGATNGTIHGHCKKITDTFINKSNENPWRNPSQQNLRKFTEKPITAKFTDGFVKILRLHPFGSLKIPSTIMSPKTSTENDPNCNCPNWPTPILLVSHESP